jgi:hypothetical protein
LGQRDRLAEASSKHDYESKFLYELAGLTTERAENPEGAVAALRSRSIAGLARAGTRGAVAAMKRQHAAILGPYRQPRRSFARCPNSSGQSDSVRAGRNDRQPSRAGPAAHAGHAQAGCAARSAKRSLSGDDQAGRKAGEIRTGRGRTP